MNQENNAKFLVTGSNPWSIRRYEMVNLFDSHVEALQALRYGEERLPDFEWDCQLVWLETLEMSKEEIDLIASMQPNKSSRRAA